MRQPTAVTPVSEVHDDICYKSRIQEGQGVRIYVWVAADPAEDNPNFGKARLDRRKRIEFIGIKHFIAKVKLQREIPRFTLPLPAP